MSPGVFGSNCSSELDSTRNGKTSTKAKKPVVQNIIIELTDKYAMLHTNVSGLLFLGTDQGGWEMWQVQVHTKYKFFSAIPKSTQKILWQLTIYQRAN